MTDSTNAAPFGAAPSLCANNPDVRILRRVASLEDFPLAEYAVGNVRRVVITDVETTGTDPLNDEIIDVAVVVIEVDSRGEIVSIVSAGEALRDPGVPILPAISQITGLTDADVAGKAIDLDRLEQRLANADVRIAHNCSFDLAFLQNLMPGLVGASWACSVRDFDWLSAGMDGAKLGHLLMQIGYFNTGHRAMADVVSLLHLLAHRFDAGATVIGTILDNAQRPSIRIEATAAPFEKRSVLKSRGYRWDPVAKVWWCEIGGDDVEDETLWIGREVTPWGPPPRCRPITWHQRHR
jgi:DNA polymerase-3 subunit epsilon